MIKIFFCSVLVSFWDESKSRAGKSIHFELN